MELVSVIIPYFRKKKYITETISSVLRQTYEYLEVIIVYDDETKVDLDFINNLNYNQSIKSWNRRVQKYWYNKC